MAHLPGSTWRRGLLMGATLMAVVWLAVRLAHRPAPDAPLHAGKPVPEWALDLNSPSATAREEAAAAIRTFGADAVPSLVHLLRTPDPIFAKPMRWMGWRLPRRVASALFRILDPFAAPARRAAAANALRIMGPTAHQAVEALERALLDEKSVAWHAALALAGMGDAGVRALTAGLSRSAPAQQGYICYALGTRGYDATNAVPVLGALLGAGSLEVAEKAGTALSKMGPAAVPVLRETLSHTNAEVQVTALGALGELGPVARSALEAVATCSSSIRPEVRAAAVMAGVKIRPKAPETAAILAKTLQDPARRVRVAAIAALQRSPQAADACIGTVRALLQDESADVREQVGILLRSLEAIEASAQ